MATDAYILEALPLFIREGREAEFEAVFAKASPIVEAAPGYISHQLQRSLEVGSKYLLLITWATLEDHMDGFRNSAPFADWAGALHPFYDPMPTMEHFERVYPA